MASTKLLLLYCAIAAFSIINRKLIFISVQAELDLFSLSGRLMELSWFFQSYLDYAIGEPEINYTLEVTVDGASIALADFFATEPSDSNPQAEHQDNYIPHINIDRTFTTVKLRMDNISTVMSMLGITGVTPADFYKFIGVLLQQVEFPTQTTVPALGNIYLVSYQI